MRLLKPWLALVFLLSTTRPALADARMVPQALARLKSHRQTQNYSFVVTGDNRDGDAIYVRILQQAAFYQPRFMLHTGDFVASGGQQQYRNFLAYSRQAAFPVLPVLGNHDVVGQGRRWYKNDVGPEEFSFQYGPDRFIFVDNSAYQVKPAQIKRLAAELRKPARYRFVVMHMPPSNMIWFHAFSEGARDVMKVLETHKANYVFLGHIHIFDKMTNNGVHYVVSGGAGAPLIRMPLYFSDRGGAYYHFVLMQVSGSGIKERVVTIPHAYNEKL